jgi:hypothetical protein
MNTDFVKTLELTGVAKELIAASTVDAVEVFEGEIYFRLKIDPAHNIFVTPAVIDKIAAALKNWLGVKIQLEIELREENAAVVGYNINRPEKMQ